MEKVVVVVGKAVGKALVGKVVVLVGEARRLSL